LHARLIRNILAAMIALALISVANASAQEVFPGHPRLFFRDSAWGERSLTTAQLRQRARDQRYKAYVNRLSYSSANLALKALLLDDSTAAAECVKLLQADWGFSETTTDGELVMWAALAFDWLYPSPFVSAATKTALATRLAQGADWCISEYMSQGAHVFHTRMYAFASGVGMAGLALKGHHANADRYIQWADSIYTKHLFPARQLQDGSVHSGMGYGRRYVMWHPGHFMSAWYSATGQDRWATVRQSQGDWAWREAEFLMYARQPDSLLIRYADCFRRTSERYTFRVIAERAYAYQEPAGFDYLNYLFRTQAAQTDSRVVEEGNAYNVLLWWDADKAGSTFTALPTRKLFSRDGTGMVFWRTGWGEDDTFVFFKCGDYFEDHGHFDQGHLEVFRHKPLLIEAGAYEGDFSGTYRLNFYHRTIAHNSLLVVNPASSADEGGQRVFSVQDHATLESWKADPTVQTGDIKDYRDNGYWSFVSGDLTRAYTSQQLSKAVREVAWIGERFLVVVDNVVLASTSLQPKILWHYTVRPQIEGRRFSVADGGGVATVSVLAPAEAEIDTVAEYHVGSAYYPPPDPRPELGVGRAEVTVKHPSGTEQVFVQVIEVGDAGQAPAEVSLDNSGGSLRVNLPTGSLVLSGPAGAREKVDFEAKRLEPAGDYDGSGALGLSDLRSYINLARSEPLNPLLDFNGDGSRSLLDALDLLLTITGHSLTGL